MARETNLKTDFPWRAVVIALVILILSIVSTVNLLVQAEVYGFKEMFVSLFGVLLLLYLLFFWSITVLEFRNNGILVNRPFRIINNRVELSFLEIDKVLYTHVAIGVPRLIFKLNNGSRIRIRYYQAGGRGELRKISRFLRDNDVEFIFKRFGAKIAV